MFRLEELSLEEYKLLVLSQDFVKMNEFIKFLFDFDNIEKNLRPIWIEILDYNYIDNKLVFNLRKNYDLLSDFINYINLKASGGSTNPSMLKIKSEAKISTTIEGGSLDIEGSILSNTKKDNDLLQTSFLRGDDNSTFDDTKNS